MKLLRWLVPRYRLRTLFVVVTVIGVLLAWVASQERIVLQRRALLNLLEQSGGSVVADEPGPSKFVISAPPGPSAEAMRRTLAGIYDRAHIPWLRRLLGDRAIYVLILPAPLEHERLHFEQVFPEADIHMVSAYIDEHGKLRR
jgi:hypothetical protein